MGAHRNSPCKDSPNQKSTSLKALLDLDSRYSNNNSNNSAAATASRGPQKYSEHQDILSLISYCSYTYTFTDPSESPTQQDLKRDKLIKLLSIIRSKKSAVPDEILSPLFVMLSTNLFRPLPPHSANNSITIVSILPDDDDFVATPAAAWPHLHMVYEILLRLVVNLEPKVLREHIDYRFILNLLTIFRSVDPRERESLKNVYHKIYSKFHSSRSFMRKAMNDVFLHYIFETEQKHSGIADLLEVWGTIINGFSIPLKEEHKLFLIRVLIPLHKPKGMQAYHKQLAYCVYQFVEKEPELGVMVVRGILKYWPVTNCQKEVLLIGELEELVEIMGPQQYNVLALPLCIHMTKCLNSWNSQVAERALYVWNNEQFVKMASQSIDQVFPVVVEGMEKNLKGHWSKSVRQLTENVKEMLEEMEPNVYSKCLSQLDRLQSETNEAEMRRKERWGRLETAAIKNQKCPCFLNKEQT